MSQLLSEQVPNVTRVLGIAMAGIPIAVATSLMSNIPAAFTRKSNEEVPAGKESKYGEHYFIEGELVDNDFLVLIDDVVTKFDTKMQAVSQVQQEINERRLTNVNCNDVAVVLDREQGASQTAKSHKVSLHSLIRFRSQALPWLAAKMSPLEWQVIDDYLEHPDKYQDPNLQQELKQEASKRNVS
jgi:orotate phosphoribosyltransferase